MAQNIKQISSEELQNLLITETSHFTEGIDEGSTFDQLKEIRLFIRAIEAEIKKRNE